MTEKTYEETRREEDRERDENFLRAVGARLKEELQDKLIRSVQQPKLAYEFDKNHDRVTIPIISINYNSSHCKLALDYCAKSLGLEDSPAHKEINRQMESMISRDSIVSFYCYAMDKETFLKDIRGEEPK